MFGLTKDTTAQGALFAPLCDDPHVFTDSYSRLVPGAVPLPRLITQFYTTRLFKLELLIFRLTLGLKVTKADADALANGAQDFAVWQVQARSDDQILLKDRSGHTLSWLMAKPEGNQTRLIFGSAVLPMENGRQSLIFKLLLPFHTLYAQALLASVRL